MAWYIHASDRGVVKIADYFSASWVEWKERGTMNLLRCVVYTRHWPLNYKIRFVVFSPGLPEYPLIYPHGVRDLIHD